MNSICRLFVLIVVVIQLSSPIEGHADSLEFFTKNPPVASLALQGFSGILNTPSAFVLPEGTLQFMYSDQVDTRWRQIPGFRQDNFHVAVGLFDFAEISGRLTSGPFSLYGEGVSVRDLSASAKFSTAPFTRDYPTFPALAVGIQDMGGGARNLQNRYAVASMDLWRFRLSAGYGVGPDRMKGVFGGGELVLFDWMQLLGEYDADDTNIGIRLTTPSLSLVPVSLQLTGKTTVSGSHAGSIDVAAGISIPLDVKAWNRSDRGRKPTPSIDAPVIGTTPILPGTPQQITTGAEETKPLITGRLPSLECATDTDTIVPLRRLQQQLEDAGFIRVRIGTRGGDELVVQYENVRFLYNELDALGLVAGMVSQIAPDQFSSVTLVTLRKGIAMTSLQAPRRLLKDFLDTDNAKERVSVQELRKTVAVSNDPKTDDVRFLSTAERSWMPPVQFAVSPGLKTHVGSEIGVFDYALSVRPEITINPWQGGLFNIRWDLPWLWSDNYDTYKPFGFQRQKSGMDRLQFTQAFKLLPSVMANIGGGLLDRDWFGTSNELSWQPEDGRHRLSMLQGWATEADAAKGRYTGQKLMDKKTLYLGSYRYNLPELDLSFEGTGGRFWNQDEGFSVGLKRFFGDVAVTVYYKSVSTTENRRIQVGGLQLSIPLTIRKSPKLGSITVGGSDEWSYAQESQVVASGEFNSQNPYSLGVTPQNSTTLERSYYNRDRFHAAYIINHLERMLDAWSKFGKRD